MTAVDETVAPPGDDRLPTDGPNAPPGRTTPQWRALVELSAAAAALTALAVLTGWGDLLLFVFFLVVMVMAHEAGHFVAAKRTGMKVTAFFFGFGPRLWSVRRGETEYGIKAIPAGGFVKIPGMTNLEQVDPSDRERTYREQPFGARMAVSLAGPAVHFVLAFVLLLVLVTAVGLPDNAKVAVQSLETVGGRPGPAHVAGVRPGDVVVSVDGKSVGGDPTVLTDAVRARPGEPVGLVVDRGGRTVRLTVVPDDGRTAHASGVIAPSGSAPFGVVGIDLAPPIVRVGPARALTSAGSDVAHYTWSTVAGVVHLFTPGSVSQRIDQATSAQAASQAAANGTRVYSVVGMAQVGSSAVHAGMAEVLALLIAINLFVGIFNLIPMLPFDGGHVAIAVYERIRTGRRKEPYHADVAKLLPFTFLMLMFLVVLIAPALVADILHPAANPLG